MRMVRPLVAAIALLSPGSLAGRPSPTAVIQGRVIAGDTGLPLRGATVQLLSEETVHSGIAPQHVTDSRGAYEFAALPAGAYRLIASPPGDQPMYLPTDRPGAGPAVVELSGDEIRRDVDFALPRAGAIGGRVSDQFGQPVAGANVQVFARGAGRRLLPVESPFSVSVSDDHGRYRAWGLPAGAYYVRVKPRSPAQRATALREGYVRTYYPGATSLAEATPVRLRTSEDLDNVDLRLELYRTFQLSGLVLSALGDPPPAGADVTLDFVGERAIGTGQRQTTDSEGRFTFVGLVPAEYELRATATDARSGPRPRSTSLTAAGPVGATIVDSDVEAPLLRLAYDRTLEGTVTTDDGAPVPFGTDSLRVVAVAADPADHTLVPRQPASVDDRGWFRLPGILAPVVVRVQGLPAGWFLRAVMGRNDVVDEPLDWRYMTPRVRLIVSTRGATLSGTLEDAGGRPLGLRDVRLFPDGDHAPPSWASRLRRTLSDVTGRFQLDAIPAGGYIVLAADRPIPMPIDEYAWAEIRRLGTPVSLGDRARETVALTLVEWVY